MRKEHRFMLRLEMGVAVTWDEAVDNPKGLTIGPMDEAQKIADALEMILQPMCAGPCRVEIEDVTTDGP